MKMEKRARQRLSGHKYKALFKLGARKPKKPGKVYFFTLIYNNV